MNFETTPLARSKGRACPAHIYHLQGPRLLPRCDCDIFA